MLQRCALFPASAGSVHSRRPSRTSSGLASTHALSLRLSSSSSTGLRRPLAQSRSPATFLHRERHHRIMQRLPLYAREPHCLGPALRLPRMRNGMHPRSGARVRLASRLAAQFRPNQVRPHRQCRNQKRSSLVRCTRESSIEPSERYQTSQLSRRSVSVIRKVLAEYNCEPGCDLDVGDVPDGMSQDIEGLTRLNSRVLVDCGIHHTVEE